MNETDQKEKREPFAMLPRSLILGRIVPEGVKGNDAHAVLLYAFLDLRQGKAGRPVRGFRYVARELGWQERTVAQYARILAVAGLIELREGDSRRAHSSAEMAMVHNPSRGSERINPMAEVTQREPRYRHAPTEYPSQTKRQQNPASASHRSRSSGLNQRPSASEQANPPSSIGRTGSNSGARRSNSKVRATPTVVREVHQPELWPVASYATEPRSAFRSGKGSASVPVERPSPSREEDAALELLVIEAFASSDGCSPTLVDPETLQPKVKRGVLRDGRCSKCAGYFAPPAPPDAMFCTCPF